MTGGGGATLEGGDKGNTVVDASDDMDGAVEANDVAELSSDPGVDGEILELLTAYP